MKREETRNDFITAFWQLYQIKTIDKISIRELCELSGYNCSTFYSYFENIYDLLDEAIEDIMTSPREAFSNIDSFENALNSDKIMYMFLSIFKSKEKYIELLLKNHHHYILEDKVKEFLIPFIKSQFGLVNEKKFEYIIEYHVSACFGLIKKWIKNNKDYSEEEIIELVYNITSKGILKMIAENIKTDRGEPSEK